MAKPEITTGVISESEFTEWNRFAEAQPTGSIYARTEYLDALCAATGGRFKVLVVRQGEQIFGGVGLYEEETSHGTLVCPRLLLYYNGPVLRQHDTSYPSEQTSRQLKTLTAIEAAVTAAGYGRVHLKSRPTLRDIRPFLAQDWKASHGYTYVVPITDLQQTRGRIEQNLRRLIDRCARAEFQFTADNDFDSFFRMHATTMDRVDFRVYLEAPVFRAFYETLQRQGLAQLFHARLPDGTAVATQLVLLGHSTTHTVSAGADPEHMKSGVTAFLRWKTFEWLAGQGYQANDLTDASLNAVTHFKSQLGGNLEPLVELISPMTKEFERGEQRDAAIRKTRSLIGAVVRRISSQVDRVP